MAEWLQMAASLVSVLMLCGVIFNFSVIKPLNESVRSLRDCIAELRRQLSDTEAKRQKMAERLSRVEALAEHAPPQAGCHGTAAAGTGGTDVSFSVVQNRIRMVRGDSAEIRLIIRDRVTGEPFTLGERDELTFTLKQNLTDEKTVLTKTLGQGIRREGAECFLVFWPDDTRRLPCGRYVYDVELVRENGYTDTLIPPRPFFLERGVTDDGT